MLHVLGNTGESQLFYDAIDDGCIFRLKAYAENIFSKRVKHFLCSPLCHKVRSFLLTILLVFFYYFDVTKDIIVFRHVYTKLSKNFDSNVFGLVTSLVLLGSVLATEIGNIIILNRSKFCSGLPATKKAILTVMAPFLPLYFCYEQKRLQLRQKLVHHQVSALPLRNGIATTSLEFQAEIAAMDNKSGPLKSMLMKCKANEMVVEHFVQMVMVLTVALVDQSHTTTVIKL